MRAQTAGPLRRVSEAIGLGEAQEAAFLVGSQDHAFRTAGLVSSVSSPSLLLWPEQSTNDQILYFPPPRIS